MQIDYAAEGPHFPKGPKQAPQSGQPLVPAPGIEGNKLNLREGGQEGCGERAGDENHLRPGMCR